MVGVNQCDESNSWKYENQMKYNYEGVVVQYYCSKRNSKWFILLVYSHVLVQPCHGHLVGNNQKEKSVNNDNCVSKMYIFPMDKPYRILLTRVGLYK